MRGEVKGYDARIYPRVYDCLRLMFLHRDSDRGVTGNKGQNGTPVWSVPIPDTVLL